MNPKEGLRQHPCEAHTIANHESPRIAPIARGVRKRLVLPGLMVLQSGPAYQSGVNHRSAPSNGARPDPLQDQPLSVTSPPIAGSEKLSFPVST